ncbi:hypothetical protein ACTA71_004270 [Dictyostelium dimigraforme]
MTNTDNMEQIDFNLFDAAICRNKDELIEQCDMKGPTEPNDSGIFIDRSFSYHVGRKFGEIKLKVDSQGTTKGFQFEFYPCGAFIEYLDCFFVPEHSSLTLYRKAGYHIHTHLQTEFKTYFMGGFEGFGAEFGYDEKHTYDVDKQDQIQLNIEFKFEKGNYYCYQYNMVMAHKLDQGSRSYIDTLINYNKNDVDIRKVGNDLYIFHAAHRKNLVVKTTDNLYKPVSYQTFIDYLCKNPDVWNTQNFLDTLSN